LLLAAVGVAGALAGCRGGTSEDPPVHLAPDMDWQAHRRAQSHSPIFADTRAMRPVDKHTVAHGFTEEDRAKNLKEDDRFFRGMSKDGKPVDRIPFEVNAALVSRGQERFNIYCAPCHDATGGGKGLVEQRSGGAFAGIPAFTLDRLKTAPDGELFQTISAGKGRMPSYAAQIPERDRWAIVSWIRVLQVSQGGQVDMLTDEEKRKLKAADKMPGAPGGGAQ
jgi:mono/diheme cytochrome c family protein